MFKFVSEIIAAIKSERVERMQRIADHKAAYDSSLAFPSASTSQAITKQEQRWKALRKLEREWESRYGFAKYQ